MNLASSNNFKRVNFYENKRVVFIVNHDIVIYNFRKEIVEALIEKGYEVIIVSPFGERIPLLEELGCKFIEVEVDRHGMNPFKEFTLIKHYKDILTKINPLVVLTFTIKPNIYGGLASAKLNIPYISNITGLGTALEKNSLTSKILVLLYKISFRRINSIFFQNNENLEFFKKKRIAKENKYNLLPGSGVNLNYFKLLPYPKSDVIKFVFISRLMKEKGIEQYLEAAEIIKKEYPNTEFHICGFAEQDYEKKLTSLQKSGIIIYHGMVIDIRKLLIDMHCTIHPSYYPEGISNVLLESASSGRPLITTNHVGCREVINKNKNGYLFQPKNTDDLVIQIKKFLDLSYEEKRDMGKESRKYVSERFSRDIVIDQYM
ncbi:glycosyltransferase family 4 protein, partial [Enterococcus faecium]|nr:glycosyltransferase family 4 protein [Enterococcus faecium]